MGDNPSHFKAFGNDHPVENVSWYDAQKFIRKLNEMEKTKAYRLPTEDEWEYACRAGTKTRYSFGDDDSKLGEYAWYSENSGKGQEDHPLGTTHPVGKKKPNSWGLFDMHGNVLEWCQDWYGSKHEGRVVRGGNFHYIASTAMSAERGQLHPDKHYMGLGFRVAQNL